MAAVRERDVGRPAAADVEPVGVGGTRPGRGLPRPSTKVSQSPGFTVPTVELDLRVGAASGELDGRLVAQHLLDGRLDQRRVVQRGWISSG